MPQAQIDGRAVPALVPVSTKPAPLESPAQIARAAARTRPPHIIETRIQRSRQSLRATPNVRQPPPPVKNATYQNPARATIRTNERIVPESSTATRPGRQFTVANVGTGGALYLKPASRQNHLRSPPPTPFGRTPRSLAPPPTNSNLRNQRRASSAVPESIYSSNHGGAIGQKETMPATKEEELERVSTPRTPPRPSLKERPRSYSTVQDAFHRPSTEDPGSFKVVIQRSSSGSRRPITPRQHSQPTLEVPIPSFRLGKPHFDKHGDPILRSSVYTKSTARPDSRHARASQMGNGVLPSVLHSSYISEDGYPAGALFKIRSKFASQASQPTITSQETGYPNNVNPSIFDVFLMQPDDPTTVRYAPNTNQIIAATPSRLVAYITSPTFLDYDLLSDFFLTFRAFMKSHELVSLLIMRLRWAVDKSDDGGRIARVRTFVALRHWILNYFLDDYVADPALRGHFCTLVNALYTYLRGRGDGGGGDIKIVSELKKCWRRTCGMYWEEVQAGGQISGDEKILPGGFVASSAANSILVSRPNTAAYEHLDPTARRSKTGKFSDPAGKSRGKEREGLGKRKGSTDKLRGDRNSLRIDLSGSTSSQGMHSMPYRLIHQPDGSNIPLFPHPVQAATLSVAPSAATSIKAAPTGPHKRNGSFSDALRDEPPSPRIGQREDGQQSMKVPTMLVVPGCLIRGALYQPATPYFDVKSTQLEKKPSLIIMQDAPAMSASGKRASQPPSTPGVRRLFGSMRKALGHKTSSELITSPTIPEHQEETTASPMLEELVTGRPPKPATTRVRNQVRIDILAARVQESFKEAVAKLEEHRRSLPPVDQTVETTLFGGPLPGDDLLTPRAVNSGFDRSLTIGSRSIVIVDDTGDDHMMSGANVPPSPSIDTINMFDAATYDNTEAMREQRAMPFAAESIEGDLPSADSSVKAQHVRKTSVQQPQVYVPTRVRHSSVAEIDKASIQAVNSNETQESSETVTTSEPEHQPTDPALPAQHGLALPQPTDDSVSLYYPRPSSQMTGASVAPPDEDIPPVPRLRKMPGGDLRAADNVHDLEHTRPDTVLSEETMYSQNSLKASTVFTKLSDKLTKTRSTVATQSLSRTEKSAAKLTPGKAKDDDAISLTRRSISLMITHSSQPNLRPSFEAEVAKFRDLPDDDDGGVESALAKLEGTYSPRDVLSPATAIFDPQVQDVLPGEDAGERKERHHHEHVEDVHPVQSLPIEVQVPSKPKHAMGPKSPIRTHRPQPSQSAVSEVSNSSLPLLERGLADRSPGKRGKENPILPGEERVRHQPAVQLRSQVQAPRGSMVSGVGTERLEYPEETSTEYDRSSRPSWKTKSLPQSFLLDESQHLSDDSDEPSPTGRSESMRSFFNEAAAEDDMLTPTRPSHIVNEMIASLNPHSHLAKELFQPSSPTMFHEGLPTPRQSPILQTRVGESDGVTPDHVVNTAGPPPPTEPTIMPKKKSSSSAHASAHLPFVLAHSPLLLAQQFTLIEKDALDEIDWRELIEMRWAQINPPVRDWVEYLLAQQQEPSQATTNPGSAPTNTQDHVTDDAQHQNSGGVDLVIARFNLVVRWVQSEILLCTSQSDRTNTITHYIRIAAACREIRNYATMYQLTVALLSSEIARLTKSWDAVPQQEMQALKTLEKLVQPVRNFGDLRAEMEGGGTGEGGSEGEGCIPFVGIYTRSLVTNAQKPAFITQSALDLLSPNNPNALAKEPLVNFDRHQTAASIVKALLRLLEASSRYRLTAEPVVLSRCLWLGSLSHEELMNRSRKLEAA